MKVQTQEKVHKGLTVAFIVSCLLLLLARLAFGGVQRNVAVASVLDDGDLSATATTATINMCPKGLGDCYTKLALIATYTAGTSTNAQVYCTESTDDSTYSRIAKCDSGPTTTTCISQTVDYVISSVTTWTTVVVPDARYVKCVYDDSADGTGTVDVQAVLLKEEPK